MKKYILLGLLILTALTPTISFAALDGVKGLLGDIREILGLLKPILYGLAFIYFFWGVGQFILHSGEEKAREEGKKKMIWGIVALFVILSITSILYWFGNLIGIPVPGATNTNNTNFEDCAEREDYYRAINCPETL